MAVAYSRYKFMTVSLPKPPCGDFRSETATWAQKRLKISAGRGGFGDFSDPEDIRHEGGRIYQAWHFPGVPAEHTPPPIRDGAPHIPKPKLISHEPPVSTGASSSLSLSLTTKTVVKIEGKRPSQSPGHFDNKPSIWPTAPPVIFFLIGKLVSSPYSVVRKNSRKL
jgi:hypothetical protein